MATLVAGLRDRLGNGPAGRSGDANDGDRTGHPDDVVRAGQAGQAGPGPVNPVEPPDLRLLPAAVAGWAVVWWATGHDSRQAAVVLGAAAVFSAVAAVTLIRRPAGRRNLLPGMVAAGALVTLLLASTWVRIVHREGDPLLAWAAQGLSTTVTGRVTTDPVPVASRFASASGHWLLHVSITSATARRSLRSGPGSMLVFGARGWSGLTAGQRIRFSGRLAPGRPGDVDLAQMNARSAPVVLGEGSWPWRAAGRLRAGLRAASAGLDADAGGLLPALVVGDTSALPPALGDDLRNSGLTHLTAVSGANLAICATAVGALMAAAGTRLRFRAVAMAVSIAGFVVLARPEPSVLRAAVMAGLGLIALVSSRPGRGVPLLCATVLILLTFDPWLSRSYGFGLSVLATAGLLLLVPAWLRKAGGARDGRPPRLWLQLICAPVAVPVAALVCTAPVTVLLQPNVSVVSVPANLLAEPAVPFATLLGVLAALLSVCWPWAAGRAAEGGGLATSWIAGVAHRGAALPGGRIPWLPGSRGALLLTALLMVVLFLSLRPAQTLMHPARRPKPLRQRAFEKALPVLETGRALLLAAASGPLRSGTAAAAASGPPRLTGPPGRPDQPGRSDQPGRPDQPGQPRLPVSSRSRPRRDGRWPPWGAVGLAVAAVVLVLGLGGGAAGLIPGPGRLFARGAPGDWVMVQCDVGQGAATLLRTGPGRAVMVDTGPDPALASRCLRRNRVDRLDLIVITHFHADHAGGLAGVLPGAGHPPILVSPLARPADQARSLRSAAAAAGSAVITGHAGMAGVIGTDSGALGWRLLYPSPELATRLAQSGAGATSSSDDGTQINDASLALLISDRGVRILILGDLETDAQQALLASLGPVDPVDVVVVAHHGSSRQYPPLYTAFAPRVALIGVGAGNDYGHPAPSALAMLRRLGVRTLRTDTEGQLTVSGPASRLRTSVMR